VMTLAATKQPVDVLFLDPPYNTGAGAVAIDKLRRLGWIGEGTWVALETAATETPRIKGFVVDSERKVGKAKITLFKVEAEEV